MLKKLLADALNFHRNGDLINAELLYEQILVKQHRNFDALHYSRCFTCNLPNRYNSAIELLSSA
jgi:hypothetical protein